MSEQKETNAFIKNIHLKGYKSVKDLSVRLNNGLNIIIGPNGSGKTNFVEFLSAVLEINDIAKFKDKYSVSLVFESTKGEFEIREDFEIVTDSKKITKSRKSKLNLIYHNSSFSYDDPDFNMNNGILLLNAIIAPTKIPFIIPKGFEGFMLSEFGQIRFSKSDIIINVLNSLFENNIENEALWYQLAGKIDKNKDIDWISKIKQSLLNSLNRFSPIKNLRFSPGAYLNITDDEINFNYLMLEFYVNSKWLTWAELSDGTKRIFHIISEINHNDGIILLEEPENGVHPDQLQLLLDFLLEQSKTKQIILTTHAPEVLNILHEDELDKIIVTRFDENTGTQMHHLSEKQKKKGQAYMKKVGHLSMFWAYSSLEKYVPEEHE